MWRDLTFSSDYFYCMFQFKLLCHIILRIEEIAFCMHLCMAFTFQKKKEIQKILQAHCAVLITF